MRIDTARQVKQELWDVVAEEASGRPQAAGVRPALPCFVGIGVLGPGRFGVAVRYHDASGALVAERAVRLARDDVDARDVGAVTALVAPGAPGPAQPARVSRVPAADQSLEVAEAVEVAEDLRRRTRPLHPGLSIAHAEGTAGTLGGLVRVAGHPGLFALSNSHVLAGSGRARLGDPVVQPGPADGGGPDDRVGVLAQHVPLDVGRAHLVDAALAELDDPAGAQATYPAGRLRGWRDLDLDDLAAELLVEKVGRTTGVTRGRVTALELDDVTVGFGDGPRTFDGQIEVSGLDGAFSTGGDSGAVVYRPRTLEAVGLLFAGSQRGGPGGAGLTYCNPIGEVLKALGATLV